MPSSLKVRGPFPAFVVKSVRRDQNGICTGTAERHFQVGPSNQRIDLIWLDPGSAPNPFGLPCTDSSAEVENGVCVVTYQYQGLDNNFTFSEDEQVTFELDTSMSEDAIETHPAFSRLKTLYGWNETERKFAEFLSDTAAGNALSIAKAKSKESPVFGIDSWLAVGAIYRRTYASKTIPPNLFDGIGAIVKRPPDIAQFRLPADARKRNWLKLAPKVSRTGNAVRVSEEWMLSGPKGWAVPIYSRSQLGDG